MGANKVLFILSLEIVLALLLICCPPIIYARALLSFLSVFIIPTISLTLLFIKDSIDFVKLLFLSLVISPVLVGAVTLLLSITSPPLNRLLFITIILFLTLTSLLFHIFRRKKVVIVCGEAELVSLSVIFIASLIILRIIIGLPHYPTPDENYYITGARLLLSYGQAFPASASFWKESLTMLFSSRILWISIVASFIASAGISPAYSNCVSLIFLSGICTASLLLIPKRYRNHPLAVAVPMLILLNPVLLMFSGFALNDLAVAFYNVASLIFFINSFKNISGKIELDLRNLVVAMLLQFSVFLIKFNIIFLMPYFLVLTINIFRFKLYKSKPCKAVTIFVILPVLMYELILDIPRNLALYGLKTRALEFLSGFLPVSPVESLILMFVSAPYSPRTVFDYTALDYLWHFYTVFSPENLSIFVASIGIFLPFLLKRTSGDIKFKNMMAITLLAMLIQFLQAISSGGWGDIPRYYGCIIAPLTVACMIIYLDWIGSKPYMMSLPLVGMLFLAWSNHVLTERYGGVVISWGVGLNETFNVLMLQTVSYAILAFVSFPLLKNKSVLVSKSLRNKTKFLNWKLDRLILTVLLLSAVVGNFYFSTFAYANSPSFRDYDLGTLTNDKDNGIVFSNSYAIGTYTSNDLFHNGFVSSMPPAEEFDSLIRSMPNGTKLIIFTSTRVTGLSESFVGSYPRAMAGRELMVPSNATVRPTEGNDAGSILHANFLNGNHNVKIDNIEVESKFDNISLIEYSNDIVPYFSGSKSFIETPYSSTLNFTPPYTIETWVIYERVSEKDAIIVDLSTKLGGYLLFIRNDKVWFSNGFGNNAYTTKLMVNQDVWTHIVVSYNGTHSVFYVDGEREIVEGPEFKPLDEEVPMWVGRYHWAFGGEVYYKGAIGIINIYDRLLSNEEVTSNYCDSFKLPYLKMRKKVSSPNGDAFVYELLSPRLLKANSDEDIVVNDLSWSIANPESPIPDLVLSLNVSSQKHCNIKVILSSDAFSRIQRCEVRPGTNIIDLKFESFIYKDHSLSPYGSIIARSSNILVIDDQCNIVLNDVTSIFQFSPQQLVGYGLLNVAITLLIFFLATSRKGVESW